MGFIDYQGTKEDRYTDVLEYAKAQQEEESRRKEDEKVTKWLNEALGTSEYSEMPLNNLLRHIIVIYRKLEEKKDMIVNGHHEIAETDKRVLWSDFCISFITRRVECLGLPEEKRNRCCQTFLEKIFRLNEFTPADRHYSNFADNVQYRNYFKDCFDLVQEKQFWRWFGSLTRRENIFLKFMNFYEQLLILTGFYLYRSIYPKNNEWLQSLELERMVISDIRNLYLKGKVREVNHIKLRNPLYLMSANDKNKVVEATSDPEISENICKSDKAHEGSIGRKLDREHFDSLINNKTLKDYISACELLVECELPNEMTSIYSELVTEMKKLQEMMDRYAEVYKTDMYMFYEYYLPEALNLTVEFLDYFDGNMAEENINDTADSIKDALHNLITAVKDKEEEIGTFASIELKAKAKALENKMGLDGHVDLDLRI